MQDSLKSEETIGCGASGGRGNEMSHVTFLGTLKISAKEIKHSSLSIFKRQKNPKI